LTTVGQFLALWSYFIVILFSLLPPNCSSVLFGEAGDTSFDVRGSVHHSIIHTEVANKMQQCMKMYYSMFIWISTCFGRHTTHHQEYTTALAASGFTVGAWW
jgi:hypothetical protein